jgi:transcriptional regulator with XRE-family HTH domain
MTNSEFCKLLRRYRKERYLTQQALVDKLKSQGYSYTGSIVSKWENGKRTPPADVVEALEDILESPKGWLLKADGYRAEAQARLSPVVDPEQTKHFQELSIALLALVSNFETYLDNLSTVFGKVGDAVYGGGLYEIGNGRSVIMQKVDKSMALNLLEHLKGEFPELANISDWSDLTNSSLSGGFIELLKLKANRGDFINYCPGCPEH